VYTSSNRGLGSSSLVPTPETGVAHMSRFPKSVELKSVQWARRTEILLAPTSSDDACSSNHVCVYASMHFAPFSLQASHENHPFFSVCVCSNYRSCLLCRAELFQQGQCVHPSNPKEEKLNGYTAEPELRLRIQKKDRMMRLWVASWLADRPIVFRDARPEHPNQDD